MPPPIDQVANANMVLRRALLHNTQLKNHLNHLHIRRHTVCVLVGRRFPPSLPYTLPIPYTQLVVITRRRRMPRWGHSRKENPRTGSARRAVDEFERVEIVEHSSEVRLDCVGVLHTIASPPPAGSFASTAFSSRLSLSRNKLECEHPLDRCFHVV